MYRWFESRLDPFPDAPLTQPPRTLFGFCRHYTQGAWPFILAMAAVTSALAVAEVWLFGFVGSLVDWLGATPKEDFWQQDGARRLLWAAGVAALLPGLALTHSLLTHQTLLGNYPMRIRWMVHRYLLGQSLSYFQNEFSGRVAAKLMQTALAVRESVLKILDVLNYICVYFLGVLVIVAAADWWLVVPFATWLVGYVSLLRYFIPRLGAVSEEQADARSVMTGRIVDSYTNMATVKLFSHSAREEVYARDSMQGFLKTVYSQMRLVTAFWVLLHVLNASLLLSVGTLAVWLWLQSEISLGSTAIGVALVLRLQGQSQWIMWEVSNLFENIGTVQDGMTSLAEPQQVTDAAGAPRLQVRRGEIQFDAVTFGYAQERIFSGLSLLIRPGERVGVIGRSGAGKSTLVNLLLRFYDLQGGAIRVDGSDIARVQQESLREQIGVVTQDTSLLHRSVRENIAYGRPDATEEMIVQAARRASAHEFISKLQDVKGRQGYDAHVGERGVNLSGGQRQRIAISRVILKDAPILVLDEATSALDSEVEAAIQDSLDELMRGKTVVAIAHRLSTIAALDRLLVFDEGRVIEEGTHSQLLAQRGVYAQLWARQSGGFLGVE